MNINDMFTQLLYSTAPIWVELPGGKQKSGTAFFYMHSLNKDKSQGIPFLITNYHVVEGAKRGLIELVLRDGEKPSKTEKIKVEIDPLFLTKYRDESVDLVAIPIGPILNQLEASPRPVFIRTITEDLIPDPSTLEQLSAVEEITFIGYPSGLYDTHNSTPIVRRGITATPVWNNFNNEGAFLIDAGVFPGSSGSPVLIANEGGFNTSKGFVIGSRVLFLGVLSESMIRKESVDTNVFLGLGKVRNGQTLKRFLDPIAKKILTAGI
ncbi:S1 family peptidase [Aeromonas hydrophila]|uniref:S1 family peptidase n=1 Tax=Aeromonas hydrophila TaxID=644 RepID=UPI002B46A6B4|nr:serine protease [Aeromonas hydrophila]